MLKTLFSKYFLEVIPSIVATVVGAYIVTHYISARSDAEKPKAAVSAPAEASKGAAPQTLKSDEGTKESAKAEAARLKAEKLALEKAAAERAAADRAENARRAAEKLAGEKAAAEKAANEKAAAEKLAAEKAASEKAAAEKRERERTVAKATAATPAPTDVSVAPERDANDLARAAIERLRNAGPRSGEMRSPEPPRAPDPVRAEENVKPQQDRGKVNSAVYAPAAAVPQPPMQPLPPAVNVAPAPTETAVTAPPSAPFPRPVDETRGEDSARLSPPADIPPRSLDLRARERDRSVAEDVVSAARSVFQAVIPERN